MPLNESTFQNLPDRIYNIKCLKSGYLPLWTPYHFWGNPHIALHQTGFFYPLNLLLYGLVPGVYAVKLMTFLDTFLAGLFLFYYLRRLRIGFIGAAGGGFVLMISSYLTGHEDHTANHNSICWIPLLFFFIEGFLQKRDRQNFAGGILAFTFMIFSGYMHTVVITGFMVLAYSLFYLCMGPNRFRMRFVLIMLVGGMLVGGALLSSIQILTTMGIVPYTERSSLSYEHFSSYFFPFSHWPMLLFPLFFGGHRMSPYVPSYQGADNMAEISGWIGVAPVFLALFGFLLRSHGRRRYASWAWLGIVTLSTLLCFGPELKPYRLMYHIPFYNMFKGAAKNWMNVHIGIGILGGWVVHSLYLISRRKPRIFSFMAVILAGCVLLTGVGMILYIVILHHTEITSWAHTQFSDIRNQIKYYISWKNPAIWLPITIVLTNGALLFLWGLTRSRYFIYALVLTLTASVSFTKKQSSSPLEKMDLLFEHPEKTGFYR